MSHNKLREDKICQNCSHFVTERFCPNCGQENTDTHQPFHYLFKHFAEDLVHYDSKFWQTIKYLLFFPGKLTNEYLSGKRKSQVAPVKLYIFISFITFFLPAILPDIPDKNKIRIEEIKAEELKNSGKDNYFDFLNMDISMYGLKNIKTTKELDSIQQKLPPEKQLPYLKYISFKKALEKKEFYKHLSKGEIKAKFTESFTHNLPKVLFIYMPFFALSLWFLHSKKRWYYFDHGIFTLHYFSFMLLTILLFYIIEWLTHLFFGDTSFIDFILIIFSVYSFYYFFHSHRKIYKESKWTSRFKSMIIFFTNLFFILIIFIFYIVYTIFTIH